MLLLKLVVRSRKRCVHFFVVVFLPCHRHFFQIGASFTAEKKKDGNGNPTDELDLSTCMHIFDLAESLTRGADDGADVSLNYAFVCRLAILVRDIIAVFYLSH